MKTYSFSSPHQLRRTAGLPVWEKPDEATWQFQKEKEVEEKQKYEWPSAGASSRPAWILLWNVNSCKYSSATERRVCLSVGVCGCVWVCVWFIGTDLKSSKYLTPPLLLNPNACWTYFITMCQLGSFQSTSPQPEPPNFILSLKRWSTCADEQFTM